MKQHPSFTDDDHAAEAKELAHSRPLDVHRWSDFPEADAFVDAVYARCQPGKQTKIERKHFKLVLLDLYVAWLVDPDLKITVSLRPAEYKAKGSRYNVLNISRKTIDVVELLSTAGLVEMKRGFYDRSPRGQSKRTRIWPTQDLIALFRRSNLDSYKIGRTTDEEVIILKDEDGNKIEYEDTPETCRMRRVIRDYNDLIARHFIDVRRLDDPWIARSDGSRLLIGPSRQRVHRVFNRSSFADGGRFYGAWWQECPKAWRREIFIDDAPTIEQDYSSLHIALLYARKRLNYYNDYEGDAYQLDTPTFLSTPEQTRKYAKALLLTAINAENDRATFSAFRSERRAEGDKRGSSLTNKQLSFLLDRIRCRHPLIADDLASDSGVTLMNEDSKITEHVITRFTERRLPVLTVHDSYIVHFAYHDLLHKVLEEAFTMVTGISGGIRSERTGVAWTDEATWETQRLDQDALTRSAGYITRLLRWMVRTVD